MGEPPVVSVLSGGVRVGGRLLLPSQCHHAPGLPNLPRPRPAPVSFISRCPKNLPYGAQRTPRRSFYYFRKTSTSRSRFYRRCKGVDLPPRRPSPRRAESTGG